MYYRWNIDINAALDIASRSKEVALKTQRRVCCLRMTGHFAPGDTYSPGSTFRC
jgi:hypothetical protein